jgi:hypothetical protein
MSLQAPVSSFALCAGIALSLLGIAGAAAAQERPIGFVSSVKGQPTLKEAGGEVKALKPLQTFLPGSKLVLSSADTLEICHEAAATAFRIEGAGELAIEANGVAPQTATLKVTQKGRCGRSVPPSVPGGVLLRKVEPTQ